MTQNRSIPTRPAPLPQVRRFMMIASATTFIAIAVVFGVIGYKVYRSGDSAERRQALPDVTESLPAAPKCCRPRSATTTSWSPSNVGGVIELRTFDPDTLKPLGRLRLEAKP